MQSSDLMRVPPPPRDSALASPLPLRGLRKPHEDILDEPSLRDFWHVLLKRRWMVAGALVLSLAVVGVVTLRTTRLYESFSRIVINRETNDLMAVRGEDQAALPDYWDPSIEMDTQVKVLQSEAIAAGVLSKLRGLGDASRPGQPAMNTDRIRQEMTVNVVPKTRVIEVRFTDPDPRMAATLANTLVATYIEQNIQARFDAVMQSSDWLTKQLLDLKVKVESSEEKLVDYQKKHGMIQTDDKQNIVISKLDQLNRELTTAEADRAQKEGAYRIVASGNPELAAKLGSSELLRSLETQESEMKTRYAQLSTQFGPSWPKVAELKNQLEQVQQQIQAEHRRMADRFRNEYLAAVQRERLLRGQLEGQKREATQLSEMAIEFNILKRDAESNRQLYNNLLQKLKEASVAAGLKSSNIRVIDRAQVPRRPSKPNIPRNVLLAVLIGLVGGVGCALLIEVLDNSIRTAEDAQAAVPLPAIAIIPEFAQLGTRAQRKIRNLLPQNTGLSARSEVALIASQRPKSSMSESYRALRTSLLLSSPNGPPRIILITSPFPQEGKTTTAVNTAIVLAQRGGRVLLVDCDLRRPGIHSALGLQTTHGLSTLLTGGCTVEQALYKKPSIPNLVVLPAGPTPPAPAELLGSAEMAHLLTRFRGEFDHVVIDTPPVLSVTDSVLLSVLADSVLIVVKSGQTTREALRRSCYVLEQVNAHVLGVVINGVDLAAPESYYYYGNRGRYYYE